MAWKIPDFRLTDMEVNGRIRDAYRIADGKTIISFECNSIGSDEELDTLMHKTDLKAVFEVKKAKRSLNANAYFWVLCDKVAKKLNKDRWEVYLEFLKRYGIFMDVCIKDKALTMLKAIYREIEIIDTGEIEREKASVVRCYIGSSNFNKEQMADLINGTIEDAKSLGIDVLPPDEISHIISVWKGNFNDIW